MQVEYWFDLFLMVILEQQEQHCESCMHLFMCNCIIIQIFFYSSVNGFYLYLVSTFTITTTHPYKNSINQRSSSVYTR